MINKKIQQELLLDDWRLMWNAPKDATEIEVRLTSGKPIVAHWAEDLSGEEQPPFQGWFKARKDGHGNVIDYAQIPEPVAWRPLSAREQRTYEQHR